jgi:hypothetical protein
MPDTFSGLVNYLRGRNLLEKDEIIAALIEKCDRIEEVLDEMAEEDPDYFSTQGWRYGILGEED